jgi:hypothetical protein
MKNLIRNKGRLFNVANALNFEIFSKQRILPKKFKFKRLVF